MHPCVTGRVAIICAAPLTLIGEENDMAGNEDFLSDADLTRVERLLDALDKSSVDFLKVDVGNLRITLGKGDPRALAAEAPRAAPSVAAPAAAPMPAAQPAQAAAPAAAAPAAAAKAPAAGAAGRIVTAPMMGRFYAQPEQGAAPFVAVGSRVEPDTTVCLIEVMKTFTAVPATIGGTVVEVLVADEAIVEFGQPLFRVSED